MYFNEISVDVWLRVKVDGLINEKSQRLSRVQIHAFRIYGF